MKTVGRMVAGLCLMTGWLCVQAEDVAVETPDGVVGIWVAGGEHADDARITLGIYPNGSYAIDIDQDGAVEFRGTWKLEADEINLTTDANMDLCAEIGATYRVEVGQEALRFDLILDACEQRTQVMKRIWERVPDIDLMAIQ